MRKIWVISLLTLASTGWGSQQTAMAILHLNRGLAIAEEDLIAVSKAVGTLPGECFSAGAFRGHFDSPFSDAAKLAGPYSDPVLAEKLVPMNDLKAAANTLFMVCNRKPESAAIQALTQKSKERLVAIRKAIQPEIDKAIAELYPRP